MFIRLSLYVPLSFLIHAQDTGDPAFSVGHCSVKCSYKKTQLCQGFRVLSNKVQQSLWTHGHHISVLDLKSEPHMAPSPSIVQTLDKNILFTDSKTSTKVVIAVTRSQKNCSEY